MIVDNRMKAEHLYITGGSSDSPTLPTGQLNPISRELCLDIRCPERGM